MHWLGTLSSRTVTVLPLVLGGGFSHLSFSAERRKIPHQCRLSSLRYWPSKSFPWLSAFSRTSLGSEKWVQTKFGVLEGSYSFKASFFFPPSQKCSEVVLEFPSVPCWLLRPQRACLSLSYQGKDCSLIQALQLSGWLSLTHYSAEDSVELLVLWPLPVKCRGGRCV